MRALLLAAGQGTRLRPLTSDRPKAMVEIAGVPAVAHSLAWLRAQGVREVAINLHQHPRVLQDFVGDGKRFGLKVRYSVEPQILGTAGALAPLRDFFEHTKAFLVLYGDVLTDLALAPMLELHRRRSADLTMAVTRTGDPTSAGIVEFDREGRVRRFVEKPGRQEVFSEWENAGIYLCSPVVLGFVEPGRGCDFGHNVIPAMVAGARRVYAYASAATFHEFGTPERLARARAWKAGSSGGSRH